MKTSASTQLEQASTSGQASGQFEPLGHLRPQLSILISNYNYGRFVDRAIESALRQHGVTTEVIVVDDGSTDESRERIERWGDRITTVLKPNGGQVSAYNAGFARARGEYIIFLDADDYLDADAGSQVIQAFAPGVVKVHFRLRLVDGDGQPLGPAIPRKLDSGDLAYHLRVRGTLYASAPGSGNAYRRSALARLMPIAENTVDRHGADLYTIYGISVLGQIASAGMEPLGAYRMHHMDHSNLHFGNAAQEQSAEPESSCRRYAHMRTWLLDRLGPDYAISPELHDFSLEKQGFAKALFGDNANYSVRISRGGRYLVERLLPAIRRREHAVEQVGLAGWAVAALLLPRRYGEPVARYLCNPGSR